MLLSSKHIKWETMEQLQSGLQGVYEAQKARPIQIKNITLWFFQLEKNSKPSFPC